MKGEKVDWYRDIFREEKSTTKDDAIKCPACKYVIDDAYEYFDHKEDEEFDCPSCDVKIVVNRDITITYTAWVKTEFQKHRAVEKSYFDNYAFAADIPEWLFA